jgi:hypothetical protein
MWHWINNRYHSNQKDSSREYASASIRILASAVRLRTELILKPRWAITVLKEMTASSALLLSISARQQSIPRTNAQYRITDNGLLRFWCYAWNKMLNYLCITKMSNNEVKKTVFWLILWTIFKVKSILCVTVRLIFKPLHLCPHSELHVIPTRSYKAVADWSVDLRHGLSSVQEEMNSNMLFRWRLVLRRLLIKTDPTRHGTLTN